MMCVDCLREDSTIQPGEHVVAEFNPWEGSTGRMFTGGLWHAECAKVKMTLVKR